MTKFADLLDMVGSSKKLVDLEFLKQTRETKLLNYDTESASRGEDRPMIKRVGFGGQGAPR